MRWSSIALIACLVLAGCSGGSKNPASSNAPGGSVVDTADTINTVNPGGGPNPSPGSPSPSPGGPSGGADNVAPSGRLVASAVNGVAPFAMNFTIEGADANGDPLTWRIDTNGDGTDDQSGKSDDAFSTVLNVTYADAGLYVVSYAVSDGALEAVFHANITVTAADGTAAGPALEFSGSVSQDCAATCDGCPGGLCPGAPAPGGDGCTGFLQGTQGRDCIWTPLDGALAGHAFAASSTSGDPDLQFMDGCSNTAGAVSSSLAVGPEAGNVPNGAACVVLWEFNSAPSTITFTVY